MHSTPGMHRGYSELGVIVGVPMGTYPGNHSTLALPGDVTTYIVIVWIMTCVYYSVEFLLCYLITASMVFGGGFSRLK